MVEETVQAWTIEGEEVSMFFFHRVGEPPYFGLIWFSMKVLLRFRLLLVVVILKNNLCFCITEGLVKYFFLS